MSTPHLNALEPYRWTCKRALHWHGNRTAAEFLAEIPTNLGLDRYGAGGAVEALEDEMRVVLGKPAAVFMPSGTMAQQIALRIHADRRGTRAVAFHPTCHLELHEERGYQRLHGLLGITIGDARGLITIGDLRGIRERLAAVLLELPQREPRRHSLDSHCRIHGRRRDPGFLARGGGRDHGAARGWMISLPLKLPRWPLPPSRGTSLSRTEASPLPSWSL